MQGPDRDADLLSAAFASRYHWCAVGGGQELIVADWMASRAAAACGHAAWLRASVQECQQPDD